MTPRRVKMNEVKETVMTVSEALVNGYKAIEKGTTDGYKAIENAAVGTYKKIEDSFVETFLMKEGETVEEAKKRVNGQLNKNQEDK